MEKLLVLTAVTIFSYIGWIIGARIGFFSAFALSMVGTGFGIYVGRRFVREYFA